MTVQSNDPTGQNETGGERRRRAYQVGSWMAHARMESEAPDDARALRAVEASDVVVVDGCYDRVECVLGALELPHTPLGASSLCRAALRPWSRMA